MVARGIREDGKIISEVRGVIPDEDKSDEEIIALAEWARGQEASKEEIAEAREVEALAKIFYMGRPGYAMRVKDRFIPLPSDGLVKNHLIEMGIPKDRHNPLLCNIRTSNHVLHCGPLAGFPPGVRYSPEAGGNILITRGPQIIKATPGDWGFLERFFEEFANDPNHPDQLPALFAWMRQARRNLLRRKRTPLPALILVGPKRAGKTFLVNLTRLILGGRAANGYKSLAGLTAFNGDTVGAELLVCDDETAHKDARTRRQLAQGLKANLFAGAVRVEAKGRDAVTLRPIHAVVMATNNEPEHLAALPSLDDSLSDKLIIIKGAVASFDGLREREAIEAATEKALPGFLSFLETTEHPGHLTDPRTGVAGWQHPAIIEALCGIQPEARLWEMIQTCPPILAAWQAGETWEGSANELQTALAGDWQTRDIIRGLLPYANSAGIYLGRLRDRFPERVADRTVRGLQVWRLRGPTKNEEEEA
jgi:hypothetical protein